MTIQEIQNKSNWNKINSNVLEFKAHSKVFNKEVSFSIDFSDSSKPKIISEKTLQTINEFLGLKNEEINIVNKEIWKHCLAYHQTTKTSSDGGITWQEFKLEDNLKESLIESEKDALSKTKVSEVYIDNNNGAEERIIWLMIETSWDPEHGINLTYINGKLDNVT